MTVRTEDAADNARHYKEAAGIVAGWAARAKTEGWASGKAAF